MLDEQGDKRMNTRRIDKVGGEPICTGYKVLNWDYKATNGDGYCYADENGNIEGGIHTTDGELSKCENGLHFCKNPLDCMKFYPPVQWNKFVAVTAFGEVIDDTQDGKSVARTLRIDKVLTYNEYVAAVKTYAENVAKTNLSSDVHGGSDVYGGNHVHGGSDVYGGNYVRGGNYVHGGNHVYGGNDVRGGSDVYGGNGVYGGNDVQYCRKCEGISRCILCYDIKGARLKLFNKDISEMRFSEVRAEIFVLADDWYPKFTNAAELREKYGNGKWEETPAPAIRGRSAKEAFADMPEALVKYIKSLPEYDEAIFNAITGASE